MHGTTEAFISKHSYLRSFLWNLYTEGYIMEPCDEVPYGPFEVPNTYQSVECLKSVVCDLSNKIYVHLTPRNTLRFLDSGTTILLTSRCRIEF